MSKSINIWIFFLLVLMVPVTAYSVYTWYSDRYEKLPVYDGGDKSHRVADFNLINQDDQPATQATWENKIVVVDFFFTHCPVICPKMTASLKRIREAFPGDEVMINSFTVDPDRDNPEKLRAYREKFNLPAENWDLVTGPKKELYKLARNSFMLVATDGDGGPQDFIHSEKLVLVDKKKQVRGYYDGTDEAAVTQMINDIKKLKNEK